MKHTVINVFFLSDKKGGNSCAIIEQNKAINAEQMQQIARQINLPETVFIFNQGNNYTLRFFATKGELPLCCHGSLGAAFYLSNKYPNSRLLSIKTYGNINIDAAIDNGFVSMAIASGKVMKTDFKRSKAAKLFNVDQAVLHRYLPCVVASVGSPKLLFPISNRELLFSLTPDNNMLASWCQQNNINGCYAYTDDTINPKSDFIARNFNPRFSDKEDAATGVSAAALCQALSLINKKNKKAFIVEQGYNLGSPNEIFIALANSKISIKGRVEIIKEAVLN